MKRFFRYLSAALTALFLAISMLPASAATPPAASSSGLSITPRKNYIINPGQTVTDKLTIGNLSGNADLNLTLRMVDFTFTDQSGTPKLNLAAKAQPTPWSLRPFTTLPQTLFIPHGETRTITYTIQMPKSQGAGSYYSAVLYQAGSANGANVSLSASGVTLVFASVPGTVRENLSLQKFGAYNSEDSGTSGSFVFIDVLQQPQMVAYTLKNEGNVFESPAGSIIVKDMFGHKVADLNTNTTSSLALLGQTRLFATCIKTVQQKIALEGGTSKNTSCTNPGLKPGKYTASLDVFYGQNGNQTKEITATATFWYLPLWFIIVMLVILAAVAGGIWWLQRKIRAVVKGTTYHAGRGVRRR
ncbi:MAG TPA: hypothetical protein VLF69_03885 [Candidatus Saccharimonadales bacterium]|nr:hypothetical protein [Candidatus Saccharimonadales bacterium]